MGTVAGASAGEHYRLRLARILDPIRGVLWGKKGLGASLYVWGSVARIPPPRAPRREAHTGLSPLSLRFPAGGRHFTVPVPVAADLWRPPGWEGKELSGV